MHLIYLWLPSPDLALARVRQRVAAGGHEIPDAGVRRRWGRSLLNFLEHYIPLSTTWRCYDGSVPGARRAVARGTAGGVPLVSDATAWATITAQADAVRRGEPIP